MNDQRRDPKPDPRLHAYRKDKASAALEGQVDAPLYVKGIIRTVLIPHAPLKRTPGFDAPLDTEVLYGEQVKLFDEREGWAWVQCQRDDYVGYIPLGAIIPPARAKHNIVTHWIRVPATFIYPAPDIKSPPLARLPMNAKVSVKSRKGDFAEIAADDMSHAMGLGVGQGMGPGFVFAGHIADLTTGTQDFVEIAQTFFATPYLWGGRTYNGIDCSGLVQTAMQASGRECLRDTDMQESSIGHPVDHDRGKADIRRGDLVFWSRSCRHYAECRCNPPRQCVPYANRD